MKTFAEALQVFTAGDEDHPAKDVTEAQRLATQQAKWIKKRYSYLDEEIRDSELAQRMILAYVQSLVSGLEGHHITMHMLMNLAMSTFRHGLIIGIEMERSDLPETEPAEVNKDSVEDTTMARQVFNSRPAWEDPDKKRPDYPATTKQIRKLLTMLSVAELIDSWFEDRERHWDQDGAVEWVRQTVGVKVKSLEDLTQKQIGACFEELGE